MLKKCKQCNEVYSCTRNSTADEIGICVNCFILVNHKKILNKEEIKE